MRNANGEGSIYQWKRNGKPDGYKGAISYKDNDGKTKRYVAYGPARQQVRAKLDKARERLTAGAPVRDAKQTVGDWLAHWRATILAASDRSDSTRALYATLSRKHLEPAPFGAIPLDKLRPSNIDAVVLAMRAKMKPAKPEAGGRPCAGILGFDHPPDVHGATGRAGRRSTRWTDSAQSRGHGDPSGRATP
jgi:hypothetical protein